MNPLTHVEQDLTMKKTMGIGLIGLILSAATMRAADAVSGTQADTNAAVITHISLVSLTHLDIGYTDHPAVVREFQRRFVDIGVDAVLRSLDQPEAKRFAWTAESLLSIDDWWQANTPKRRKDLVRAVRSDRFEVAALPMNMAPFLGAAQWDTMTHWIPEEVWSQLKPRVAIQNDVNGLPRAGAMRLLDRDVRYLWFGLNTDSGGTPFKRPVAFWWKMPDGRRMLVFLASSYWEGFDLFARDNWRPGMQAMAADTRFRPPRPGDMLRSDEASVREAHAVCLERLQRLVAQGYRYPSLPISFSNQWRCDNDPPFTGLTEFVATWKRLGLKPELELATAGAAIARLEKEVGATLAEQSGEWTDWWANGVASMPRELAAARRAARLTEAARSPVFGPADQGTHPAVESIHKELCLFSEHTVDANECLGNPFSAFTLGHEAEKAGLAFRSLAKAEWLLSQRARTRWNEGPEGLYVANPADAEFHGWVPLLANAFRGVKYLSVEESETGTKSALEQAPQARFWADLAPGATKRFLLKTEAAAEEARPSSVAVEKDALGWPSALRWAGMTTPLFVGGLGDFLAVGGKQRPPAERAETWSKAEQAATGSETAHTLVFEQPVQHPRLAGMTRRLEVWKDQARVRLTVRFSRLSSMNPERFFLQFPLPTGSVLPKLSNGGLPFTAYEEVLGEGCRDYFAIDGWVHYATAQGDWLWVGHDSAMVTFGEHNVLAQRKEAPANPGRLLALLYDNLWYTNFPADRNGDMEFRFDLVWKAKIDQPAREAEALMAEPVVLHNPATREDPIVQKRLYQP